ncbi:efflux RND transporter periplasmic adaptor subunit [Pseudomonas sp. 10B1]|uniref:efflux RND transporter periplasmic adaptor subunit n=1 Tax=unclassified Pseudomonas TaxID=196821 RepID=UPI002AB572D9|nr:MULTISPECIES: efflux RND transporter periplasmic adaptor subunit [unclassified Pseudomonas]MDY7562391.1 efflux RND transporter periplasmic adaptor subunit [Pseudomonas sp. AB6]MEA9978001.1 efflux RND transporter periplasmic adaptor subunit [Pseudomonas sp. RTS4]MEA9994684.1 efflux RND transporter periplasmic adaptor subunit [Pseudomonas sp. AA4]MEB0086347.1 efflux RND transporter periplasmic adaptor subunit [Pseudomonas sp. RTI1]MEB0126454.1 efflux RND transporter periplasmic adaptor subuni
MTRLTLMVLSSLMMSACSKSEPAPEPARPVLYIEVQPASVESLGRFAGNIQARYESTLGFRVSGRIAQRSVDVGSEVKNGQLLATLDPTDQQNNLRGRQSDLARIEAQWINTQANARRQRELFDRGVGAQAQLDIAQTDLRTIGASLEQARAAVTQAQDQLNYSDLRADHAAVVTNWKVEAGQVVSAGQDVVTLAQPDIKEAVIDLPASLVDTLHKGVEFKVAAQLAPDISTTATLREIEPQAERSTRTRRARLTLTETPSAFRLGTAISVTLSTAIEPRVQLPINAVQNVDGKTQIWIVDVQNQTVSPREVQVISREDDSVVLAAGVKAGERVVSAGVNSLKPGQKVKIDKDALR